MSDKEHDNERPRFEIIALSPDLSCPPGADTGLSLSLTWQGRYLPFPLLGMPPENRLNVKVVFMHGLETYALNIRIEDSYIFSKNVWGFTF